MYLREEEHRGKIGKEKDVQANRVNGTTYAKR